MRKIILASTSPRRRDLLRQMGIDFEVVAPEADETVIDGAIPEGLAAELAARKAQSVAHMFPDAIIIGADTIVASADGEIIGKPADAEDAKRILRKLSGSTHSVITGLCLLDTVTGREDIAAEETLVTMRKMTEEEIENYVSSGEALGKAGAYAIQETGDVYVNRIQGSFNNVVGLPTEKLEEMLEAMQ